VDTDPDDEHKLAGHVDRALVAGDRGAGPSKAAKEPSPVLWTSLGERVRGGPTLKLALDRGPTPVPFPPNLRPTLADAEPAEAAGWSESGAVVKDQHLDEADER
jgi:hypothetical protein